MDLANNWESFIRIHGDEPGARDKFEKVILELIKTENPGKEVHIVKASRGDGGIDVYVHHTNGIDIYQCKFFMGSMTPSRWSQVRKSFSRAMELEGVPVLRWYLCMPREMQKEDIETWDSFCKERQSYNIEICHIDGDEIIRRMKRCDQLRDTNLIDRYFGVTESICTSMDIAIMEVLNNLAKSTSEGFRKDISEKTIWFESNIKLAKESIAFIKENWPL